MKYSSLSKSNLIPRNLNRSVGTAVLSVPLLRFSHAGTLNRFVDDQIGQNQIRSILFIIPSSPFGQNPAQPYGQALKMLDAWLSSRELKMGIGLKMPVPAPGGRHSSESGRQMLRLAEKGLKMVWWQAREPGNLFPCDLMWQLAKSGVWNHVAGTGILPSLSRWIQDNPNSIHSYSLGDTGPADAGISDYNALAPLPGIPLWKTLPGPEAILELLGQYPSTELLRLRTDPGDASLIVLGSQLTYHFVKPGDLPLDRLDEICAMVSAGGSVGPTHVRSNLKRAYLIGYALEHNLIVGNSSLKHPRPEFVRRIKADAGVDLTGYVERGYTSVRPEYRAMGIGAKLLGGLTCRAQGLRIFSIISEDNLATQKIALRNRTQKVLTYYSRKLEKEMGIWMPEQMSGAVDSPEGGGL